MSEDEIRERVGLQVDYQPQEAAVEPPAGLGGRRRRRTPGASAATGCGSCTPTTPAGAGSRPAMRAADLARSLFPEAHVERIENGIISRPDLTGGGRQELTAGLRAWSRGRDARRPRNRAWILTGSLENFRVNVERGFDVIGIKERRRRQAERARAGRRDRLLRHRRAGVRGDRAGPVGRCSRTGRRSGRRGQASPRPIPGGWRPSPIVVLEEADFVAGRGAGRPSSSTSASGRPSTGTWRSRASCGRSREGDAALCGERIEAAGQGRRT